MTGETNNTDTIVQRKVISTFLDLTVSVIEEDLFAKPESAFAFPASIELHGFFASIKNTRSRLGIGIEKTRIRTCDRTVRDVVDKIVLCVDSFAVGNRFSMWLGSA